MGVSPAKELCSSTCLYFCKMLSCLIHENNLCSSPQFTDEETVTHRAEVIFRRPTETTGRADAENESSRDKPAKGPPLLFYTTKVKIGAHNIQIQNLADLKTDLVYWLVEFFKTNKNQKCRCLSNSTTLNILEIRSVFLSLSFC